LELADRLGYKLLKDHGPLHPESWPGLATRYAEPFVRHAFESGRYDFIYQCLECTGSPAGATLGRHHDLTPENFLRVLECLCHDVLDAANFHLRLLLDVEEFRLLDLDNSDFHKGTWTGHSYLGHACFLNRSDIDCEWNDHDNAYKEESLAFYSASEAFLTVHNYLGPYQAINLPRNVIVVATTKDQEIIYYNQDSIEKWLANKPDWTWHKPKKKGQE